MFSEDESKQLQSIERVIGYNLEREIISGYARMDKPKALASSPFDDEVYGNFEADLRGVTAVALTHLIEIEKIRKKYWSDCLCSEGWFKDYCRHKPNS